MVLNIWQRKCLVCQTWRDVLVLVNVAGSLRDFLLNKTVGTTRQNGCEVHKTSIPLNSVLFLSGKPHATTREPTWWRCCLRHCAISLKVGWFAV
jgi:hypothetical protein